MYSYSNETPISSLSNCLPARTYKHAMQWYNQHALHSIINSSFRIVLHHIINSILIIRDGVDFVGDKCGWITSWTLKDYSNVSLVSVHILLPPRPTTQYMCVCVCLYLLNTISPWNLCFVLKRRYSWLLLSGI